MKGKYQSGQMGQTVNLLAYAFGGSNPSLPTNFEGFKKHDASFSDIKESDASFHNPPLHLIPPQHHTNNNGFSHSFMQECLEKPFGCSIPSEPSQTLPSSCQRKIRMAMLVSTDVTESQVEMLRTELSLLVDWPIFTLLGST